MPIQSRTSESEQPLARPVRQQPLARPVSGEQEEAAQGDAAEHRQAKEEQTAPQAKEARQEEKGPITRAIDKAQENNWVYDAMAQKAREKGLLDKADEFLSKARNKLGGA